MWAFLHCFELPPEPELVVAKHRAMSNAAASGEVIPCYPFPLLFTLNCLLTILPSFCLLVSHVQSDLDHEGSALLSAYKKGGFMAQLNSDSTDFDSEAVVNVLVMGVTGGIGIDQRSFDPKKTKREREQREVEGGVNNTVPGEVELRL